MNVGDYIADLVVEDQVIIEARVVKVLEDIHMAQCLSYRKAAGPKLGLVVNFAAPRIAVPRMVNGL